ncbi:FHA domain-containing protein FhaB/FipA [Herbiconiux sp. SYSU D00978]|uniref:FHA domain-containing protein FhaB/FipA n=1 Tax=Herbiconiux sp. SYSU D00978 TaxID=2812562 RepID=UPI001A97036D|nr:FHA domain-containing protein [Herbiconiux sp. SYSU D00978]
MTSELTLLVLQLAFLAVLWLFVFGVVYALRTDLFGQRVRRLPAEQQQVAASAPFPAPAAAPPMPPPQSAPTEIVGRQTPPPSQPGSQRATRLVITSGAREGVEIPLGNEPLTIGRSSESDLVIRDDYTSTHHARLMLWKNEWAIQDLDSTNGTFLDGRRVTLPTPVPLNTPVKIGTTTFELRR